MLNQAVNEFSLITNKAEKNYSFFSCKSHLIFFLISRNVSAIFKKKPPTAATHVIIPDPSHRPNKNKSKRVLHPSRKSFLFILLHHNHHRRGLIAPDEQKQNNIAVVKRRRRKIIISKQNIHSKSCWTKYPNTPTQIQPYTKCYQFTHAVGGKSKHTKTKPKQNKEKKKCPRTTRVDPCCAERDKTKIYDRCH